MGSYLSMSPHCLIWKELVMEGWGGFIVVVFKNTICSSAIFVFYISLCSDNKEKMMMLLCGRGVNFTTPPLQMYQSRFTIHTIISDKFLLSSDEVVFPNTYFHCFCVCQVSIIGSVWWGEVSVQ